MVQNICFERKKGGGGHPAWGIKSVRSVNFCPLKKLWELFYYTSTCNKASFSTLHADRTCDEEMVLAMLCCGKCMPSCLPCCPAKSLPIRDSARLMMSRIRWIKPSLSEGRMNSLCTWKKENKKEKEERESDRGHWTAWRKNNIMEWKSRDKQSGPKPITVINILSDYICIIT